MARRPAVTRAQGEASAQAPTEKAPQMIRGVSQLLFNYLPERTVDWEDGLAIVRLGGVHLSAVWAEDRSKVLLEEIAALLDRWRSQHGAVDPNFPDPHHSPGRFAIGAPKAIDAMLLDTAYVCQACHALTFPRRADLAHEERGPLRCRACGSTAVRQFGQVFVHGCGELIPVGSFIPFARNGTDGTLESAWRPLRCEYCGDNSVLEITAHSERVSEMKIVCRSCHAVVVERMTARCPRCTTRVGQEQRAQEGVTVTSPVARIAMRLSRYSANDTYYPQTLTVLRLDRPALRMDDDVSLRELRSLLSPEDRAASNPSQADVISALSERLHEAEALGDTAERMRLLSRIADIAGGRTASSNSQETNPGYAPPILAPDLNKALQESLAFRTTVNTRPALDLARESATGELLSGQTQHLTTMLGLREIALVDDLPVINATFGYTRRSFEPTYEELGAKELPTEIRVFPSLDLRAAHRLGRDELAGSVPVLAREGEHQGLYLSLDPDRVLRWLLRNGLTLPDGASPIARILAALEPVGRYYDDVWEHPARRLIFGLVHTLSHVVMRATSWFAGLDRTSLSEYLFLPLLGTVVFDTSSAFQLGGIETMVRDNLTAFLEQLSNEALTCVYDTDCIDSRGACHGCVHSPEITCRFFNHGLSRAFLIGGHVPWLDVSDERQLVGYWQEDDA